MLKKNSMRLAQHLAVAIENFDISNPHDTIFDDAIRYSLPMYGQGFDTRTQGVSVESAVTGVEETADDGESGFSPHEAAVSDATELLMSGLIKQFSYVRNTVLPTIGHISDDVLARVKDTEPKEYDIVQYEASDLVKSSVVREIVSKYKQSAELRTIIKNGPERDAAHLINKMKTGVPELDEALASSIALYGEDVIVSLYNAFFRGEYVRDGSELQNQIYNILQRGTNGTYVITGVGVQYTDLPILLYFLVDSLVTDPLEGTGLGLQEYENALTALRNQTGLLANRTITNYENDIKTGTLIIRRPITGEGMNFRKGDGQIIVFGEVYRQLLAQDIGAEVVIGGATMTEAYRQASQYVKNKDVFLANWNTAVKNRESFSRRSILTRISDALIESSANRIRALPDDQFPAGVDRLALVAGLREKISDIPTFFREWDIQETPNVYALVEEKVCHHLFPFVDAKDIIDGINKEMEGGETEVKIAVFYAGVKYLAKWCAANFEIRKV